MSTVYLIPSLLAENATATIPLYIVDAVKECKVFFVENERSARRFLKLIWKEIIIDDYKWITIHKAETEVKNQLMQCIDKGINAGIISEAGCPGIADPGQVLVAVAHRQGATVRPLVGPSSILLALMASGLNGQQFAFAGYLPIDHAEKIKALKHLELESSRKNSTQVFIETPYRNNQLLESIIRVCQPSTYLSIAADITSENEWIKTKTILDWRKQLPDLHKRPVIFCLLGGPLS
ncbi:MAG: SAM-dependent methyltransferase [Chitinophagaceae bacterium]|nr:SAM-dependent methyltransferase [Chitinophagaceae bacterium]